MKEKQKKQRTWKKTTKSKLCPVCDKCGGCQYLDISYEEQLAKKQKYVEGLLNGVCPVESIVGMHYPYHYRNKVHAVFGIDRKKNVISGTYQEGTHYIVPVEECLIEDKKADEIIRTIRGMLKSFKIKTYDEDSHYGLLRHVLVRRGFTSGQIMVVLVTASPVFPSKNNFVKALREKHPEITTVVQNINERQTSMVLGIKENVLYGKGYIEDELCGLRFRISSRSFYQVNSLQTEKLYGAAIEMAALTGKETVVDAYCGIGTMTLIAASHAKKVIGVELNKDAVKDAIRNAKENKIRNADFYCNDAGVFLREMAEQKEKVDVVLMDPPRSGSTEEFIRSVAEIGPSRVIYVSCGPDTLARDLKLFQRLGYKAEKARPYDMFPMTQHVETVCLLSNTQSKKKESYITLDVEMEDYYRIKNEGKNSTT
ncbi:MAG: 23S rRNA (uracil(1939)-C(5))-methyltransferase RlmD [Bacillota bacterium]|nr:23S rRNA (uracil(1939)-C(5))-methyltransferase RlmD [Bacillota bacterium]